MVRITASPLSRRRHRQEVVPEGLRVLEAVGRRFGIEFKWDEFPWSCEYRASTGACAPRTGFATIRKPIGLLRRLRFPGVPDHVSLWSS